MGIWNRWKRAGSPDSPGMETFPDSPGMETFPDSFGTETFPDSPGMETFPDSFGMETFPDWPDIGTLPHSIGIETMGGTFTPLISQGTPLPVSVTEIFTTGERNQSSITIRCFQGEESRTAGNMDLGLFELTEIPPGSRGEPQIEVTFHVDASGAFSITARDRRTGRDLPVLRC
jgi:molecular chaperone DnaK (HSP70)